MIYFPDTNAFSGFLAGHSEPLIERMTEALDAGDLRLSVMVAAELEFGAERARTFLGTAKFGRRVAELRRQIQIEPIGAEFPRFYARVRTELEAAGRKIGDRDTIIAAHALSAGATIVTANVDEFTRVRGLKVENWQSFPD